MKIRPFGLDIGATTMKTVWLTEDKDGFSLNAVATFPTPPRGMLSESPLDQEEMAQSIRSLVKEAKITTPYVNIALPENQVYTKVIEMPYLSDKELSTAIYWEAEQYIPVPLAQITFDYKVLKKPQEQDGSMMQILLVGAPTILLDKYNKIIALAGLSAVSAETEILSAIRALSTDTSSTALIINIGALSTAIAIVSHGTMVFAYVIPIGGAAITRAIASDFGLDTSQAEEYKRTYGYSSNILEGKVGKSTEPILSSMITEVKKALAFYSEKYKNEDPIVEIILCGGTAKLPGINLYFSKEAGIETIIANPWKMLKNQDIPKEIQDSAPDYTIAMGLAMKDYE